MTQSLPTHRVPDALRVALFSAKVSQQKAASVTGYSSSAISRRLAGDTPITLDDLNRIAAAAGLDVQIILTEKIAA
ncbi:helix-turn-helix domain-containing protein [Glaciibacter psychrotolerans]|uniref:Transcriptional regulator with XRE-family HTH domain n=1 Tax=Glaciibacter psychrotolerans TaxID=670054 RepID=A0A7Z0J5H3_9MICO|nr:helix-turn-helix transcriptional regulator [Leifsonia psychrotolerans]NYJ19146.1 transcriptional regulator with XRE-family HTH domain [Leifsonia psychrotolerans]